MRPLPKRSKGAALIILIALLTTGVLYFLVQQLEAVSTYQRELQLQSSAGGDVLAQAKEALLGFAATYRDDPNHATEVFGYLPCPDMDGDGYAETTCTAGVASVGLLPYKTLGLPDLRDSNSGCLWYAVSANYKEKPKTAPLNWDTQGQFKIVNGSGVTLAAPDESDGGAAAVIFAAGAYLSGDRGNGSTYPCNTDPTKFAGFIDGYYDTNAGTVTPYSDTTFATAGTINLTQGPVTINNELKHNDKLAWITPREVFDRIVKRKDFYNPATSSPNGHINKLTDEIKAVLEKNIQDDLVAGSTSISQPANTASFTQFASPDVPKQIGTLPSSLTLNDLNYSNYYSNWYDQYRLALCGSLTSTCLTVAGTACRGALMFGGRNANGQPRTSGQKAFSTSNLDYLFEAGSGQEILKTSATSFSGLTAYTENGTAAGRALDVGTCLFPGDFKSFDQNIGDFASGTASATPSDPQVIVGSDRITLYAINDIARSGCVWASTPMQLTSLMRVYFRFQLVDKGQGFTFTIADAATNDPNATNPPMCGNTGTRLGYAGAPPGYSLAGINPPKIGLEFDLTYSSGRNDPTTGYDHVAFDYWGSTSDITDDVTHGSGTTNSATAPKNPRLLGNSTVSAMSWSGGTVTVTTTADHEMWTGQSVKISSATPSAYNGTYTITVLSSTQFSFPLAANPGTWTSGGTVATDRGIATVNSSDPYLLSTSGKLPTTTATVPYLGSSPKDTVIHVRLDIAKSYDSATSTGTYTLTAYVGDLFNVYDSTLGTYSTCSISDFKNLSRNLSDLCSQTPKVKQSNVRIQNINGEAFRTAYIGFTTSRGSSSSDDQNIVISNLLVRSQ